MFIIAKQEKCITELARNLKLTKRNHRETQKLMLEDFILTINEIQDVQASKRTETEKEKDEMRNKIIDYARKKYVTKLIELSNSTESI